MAPAPQSASKGAPLGPNATMPSLGGSQWRYGFLVAKTRPTCRSLTGLLIQSAVWREPSSPRCVLLVFQACSWCFRPVRGVSGLFVVFQACSWCFRPACSRERAHPTFDQIRSTGRDASRRHWGLFQRPNRNSDVSNIVSPSIASWLASSPITLVNLNPWPDSPATTATWGAFGIRSTTKCSSAVIV